MTTKTRKPEVVEWEPATGETALAGLLAVGTGRRRVVYAVQETPTDRGRAFVLAKVEGGTDDEATGYVVQVTAGGQPRGCECRGWLRWNHCRHTREVGKLVATGAL